MVCAMLGLAAGCSDPWRALPKIAPEVASGEPVSLAGYYPDGSGWRWTYQRTRGPDRTITYVRRIEGDTYTEGSLIGRRFDPLTSYLNQDLVAESPDAAGGDALAPGKKPRKKRAPLRGKYGVLITVDPPLPPLPRELRPGEPQTFRADLSCYSETGRHWYDGHVRRSVALVAKGPETVRGVRYDDVLRLRLATRFYFHWSRILDIDQTVWLAPGVGVLRRVDQITGWILLLPYSSTERMELVHFHRPADYRPPTPKTFPGFRRCRHMAAEVASVFPRPRLGGLHMELAGPAAEEPYSLLALATR